MKIMYNCYAGHFLGMNKKIRKNLNTSKCVFYGLDSCSFWLNNVIILLVIIKVKCDYFQDWFYRQGVDKVDTK
jgi:hypothetical protein